jgi:hypothetical protein
MIRSSFRSASSAAAVAVGVLMASASHVAWAQSLPPGANTTNPSAPFYIDLSGLDFSTSPPTRDPKNPKYPNATELPDGTLPSTSANGNFIIGPTHKAAPEAVLQNVPKGKIFTFTMTSEQSKIYNPGFVRAETVFDGAVNTAMTMPGDPSNVLIPTSYPGTWTRTISVYVPAQLRGRHKAPLLVVGDGGLFDTTIFTVLDNLIHQRQLPAMVAVTIQAGGQDAQGSQRGFEYDAVNGLYAEFVEHEVLPLVERKTGVRLTKDPDARATMGISSSGAAAFTMAWFHPEWYHRVLAYSPTMVNQQWPHSTALRGGAWEYHSPWPGPANPLLNANGFNLPTPSTLTLGSPLIPLSDTKPIRFWYEVGDRDLWYPNPLDDGMHDWVLANETMAKVLAAKNYQYQFIFARNAGHVDFPTLTQTLGQGLRWVWAGYQRRDRDDD